MSSKTMKSPKITKLTLTPLAVSDTKLLGTIFYHAFDTYKLVKTLPPVNAEEICRRRGFETQHFAGVEGTNFLNHDTLMVFPKEDSRFILHQNFLRRDDKNWHFARMLGHYVLHLTPRQKSPEFFPAIISKQDIPDACRFQTSLFAAALSLMPLMLARSSVIGMSYCPEEDAEKALNETGYFPIHKEADADRSEWLYWISKICLIPHYAMDLIKERGLFPPASEGPYRKRPVLRQASRAATAQPGG